MSCAQRGIEQHFSPLYGRRNSFVVDSWQDGASRVNRGDARCKIPVVSIVIAKPSPRASLRGACVSSDAWSETGCEMRGLERSGALLEYPNFCADALDTHL